MSEKNESDTHGASDDPQISPEMISAAAVVAGHDFSEAEIELMLDNINQNVSDFEQLRTVRLDNGVAPALFFQPHIALAPAAPREDFTPTELQPDPDLPLPADPAEVAFRPVSQLARWLKAGQISSVRLTEIYLDRLKRHGPQLECVITLLEEQALAQARRADEEIAAGRYRGPLHGIPWGAKDLLATRGVPTTWGAAPFQSRIIDLDAAVVQRLEAAGAVLLAKLSMGALAWGDVWFGGKTRSPWNLEKGSSGSSAGSGAATAAGLVGFAIGTETLGSIVSPSAQCGLTGLRPTFGRVSRYGAMALAWSMDKIGPMCRSVEDCALVFDAIYGPDGHDPTVVDYPFRWPPDIDFGQLRIGYVKQAFAEERPNKVQDDRTLAMLRALGADLIPIDLPADYPLEALRLCLWVEAAAAFDELTRSNRDDLLVRQIKEAWPNKFRQARLVPAVEYVQANRIRSLVMKAMAGLMADIDLYLIPTSHKDNLTLTNLTGHPAVALPTGFAADGLPTSMTFIGRLYDEAVLLAAAKAYQDATDFHTQRPTGF